LTRLNEAIRGLLEAYAGVFPEGHAGVFAALLNRLNPLPGAFANFGGLKSLTILSAAASFSWRSGQN